MVDTDRNLKLLTSALLLVGVLAFPLACQEVEPLRGCEGNAANCGDPDRFLCVQDQCVRQDPCGAGVFRFNGRGGNEAPYIAENLPENERESDDDILVRQVFSPAQISEGIRPPTFDGEAMLLPADGARYPMRFEVDWYDAADVKNSEERLEARNGQLLGLYAEAKLSLDEGALECAAYMALWATPTVYAKFCIGGEGKLYLDQGERQQVPVPLDALTDFDPSLEHIYRLEIMPQVDGDGNVTYRVNFRVDGTQVFSDSSEVFTVPSERPDRFVLYQFGTENTGGSQWDYVRWGCNPDGGPCYISLLNDDDANCQDTRNSGGSIRCPGGRGVAEEICDNIDNNCDGQRDEIFFKAFGPTARLLDNPLDPTDPTARLELGEACTIGACTESQVRCHPTDPLSLVCDPQAHFAARGLTDPPTEECNDIDDDCDSAVDEDFGAVVPGRDDSGTKRYVDPVNLPAGRSEPTAEDIDANGLPLGATCGVGACQGGVVECSAETGKAQCSNPPLPSTEEECGNNRDDDCDGRTDEGQDTDGDGIIDVEGDKDGDGFQACDCLAAGRSTECDPTVQVDCDDADRLINPGADEACNDRDDNCNDLVDEGFDLDEDGFWSCPRVCPPESCTEGRDCCQQGPGGDLLIANNQDCFDQSNNELAASIFPGAEEVCNNEDDDCDDKIDEGNGPDDPGFVNNPSGDNPIARGYFTAAHCGRCGNDCATSDDRQGKNFRNQCDRVDGLYECSTQCAQGFFDANGNDADGCECRPQQYENCSDGDQELGIASATGCVEACDGFDNDCDGRIDEGAPTNAAVVDVLREGGQRADLNQLQLVTRPCFTGGGNLIVDREGSRCRTGRQSCIGGEQVGGRPDQCIGQVLPLVREDGTVGEICNGIDDDCDGQVDEDTPREGEACAVPGARGICSDGEFICQDGNEICEPRFQANVQEVCNLTDDDCDGRTDEGFDLDGDGFRTCGGIEACRPGVPPTTAAGGADCDDDDNDPFNNCICPDDCNDDPDTGPLINRTRAELCNNVDDNCDNNVDEAFVRLDATGRPVLRNGARVYSESTQHCSQCGLGCEDLPNILPGSTACVDDGLQGACTFECLPNYQNRDGDWTNGCETAQCTVETVGAQKFGQLGLSCQKAIYDDPNPDDNIDVCACQGTFRCVEIADRAFDVKCIVDPGNANAEPDQVSVDYCVQAVGNRNQIRNDRQETCDDFDNDCDGRIDEDFQDDRGNYSTLDHCGACDNACAANNADPRCVRGVCTLAQDDCALNFYDANGRLDDGCEYFCVQTSQDDRVCNGQDDDCDGCRREDPDCDFDAHIDEDVPFEVDPQNCGQCGNVCSFANAIPRCSEGACAIDRVDGAPNTSGCTAGFADCDDDQATGCEVEIRGDRNNCGGCGVQCNPDGADACTGGVCTCGARASCNDPNSPICDPEGAAGQECVECLDDEDCTNNPNFDNQDRRFCINKSCRQCNPIDSSGCDGLSQEPICDRQVQTCRGCQNDAQCTVLFAERPICVTENGNPDEGQCVLCNPDTNAGCGGNTPTCQRNVDGSYECRACQNDADCGGNRTCIADDPATPENEARCSGCNVLTNEGCANPTPICRSIQGGGERCEACANNNECPAGQECVEGSCRECNPENNAGCEADELCCNFECVNANNVNGCEVCGVACDATTSRTCLNRECVCGAAGEGSCGGATPFCNDQDQECVSCRDDADCPAGPRPLCVDVQVGNDQVPQCQECDPADNRGCDPNSANPVCDPVRYICRGCVEDGECGDPGRGQCVANGSCQLCDPSDDAGCTPNGASVCTDQFQCRGCQADVECAENPNGNLCTNQRCEPCAGADPDSDCATHPDGNVCLASVDGAPRRCGACDPDALGDGGTLIDCDEPRQQGQREGHSTGNICRNDRCVACNADAECAVANPAEPYCFEGRCQACDPDTDAPCEGATPVCNPFSFTCEACAQDGDCNDGRLCVEGACVQCDPDNDRGCAAAAPVCAGDPPLCRPCVSDQECDGNANGAFCFEGQCRPCNPNTDSGCNPTSNTPVCSPNFACVGCGGDGDCATNANNGSQCILASGRCEVCDPADNNGCGDDELCCNVGGTPTCEATSGGAAGQCEACDQACSQAVANSCNDRSCGCGNGAACDPNGALPRCGANGCVECLVDGDCAGDTVCNPSTNTCETCRLGTHEGCAANQLCCNDGQGPSCVATGAGPEDSCGACGASCDQARSNRCTNRVCQCGDEVQCLGGTPFCDDNVNNGGADAACVQCLDDADCGAGGQCVNKSCGSCDPNDNSGCNPNSTTPFCSDNGNDTQCAGCNTDQQCAGDNNNGPKCVKNGALDGACVDCLANTDCDQASGTPICSNEFDCVRCTDDNQCAGNPNGTVCNVVSGACVTCVEDTDCNQQGVAPVCGTANNRAACVGCSDDNDCVGNPVGGACHPDGSCEVCADDSDCAGQAGTPICDSQTRTCRACTTADNGGAAGHDDCEGFQGEPVCNPNSGECQECVANTDCGANELCCADGGGDPTCEATAPGVQCTACDSACNADVADTCANRTCQCGNNAACAGGLFCDTGACVECRDDNDCNGADVCSANNTCGAAAGAACQGNGDCATGYCQLENSLCRPATCNNNQQDNDENGIDCGGPCGKCDDVQCLDGQNQPVDTDCASGFCQPSTGLCRPASCDNGVVDAAAGEDDTDCGGDCGACDDAACDNQNNDTSCASGYCQDTTGLCRAAQCGDGQQNNGEAGTDCGGVCGACNDAACADGQGAADDSLCASGYCQANNNVCKDAHCGNDQTDAGEQEAGVDCGPNSGCGACQGVTCANDGDCETGYCEESTDVCRPFHCSDGQQNNGETGTDCGGPCSACNQGVCNDPSNDANDGANEACVSGYCQTESNRCRPASCDNNQQDAGEGGVDCGGACGTCDGGGCADGGNPADHFCTSGYCQPLLLTCRATECNDNQQNNGETDVDCGNAACGACDDESCDNNGNPDDDLCASGYCEEGSKRCRPAHCANNQEDPGDGEGGVDCGGNCGDCDGSGCAAATECFSGFCSAAAGNTCRPASCDDNQENNDETDVDCGGSCGATCTHAQGCDDADDCTLARCDNNVCGECNVNGNCAQNDKGSFCRADKLCGCEDGNDCDGNDICLAGTCRASHCDNGNIDGDEDLQQADCGGSCGACNGTACTQPDDCASNNCNNGTCAAAN